MVRRERNRARKGEKEIEREKVSESGHESYYYDVLILDDHASHRFLIQHAAFQRLSRSSSRVSILT